MLELADRLRVDGIDASIDQYLQFPPEGWPVWCEAELEKADFVLMVCTETYFRRVDRKEEPGKGHGVLWEVLLIGQLLYDAGSVSAKFVPVLVVGGLPKHVPAPVREGPTLLKRVRVYTLGDADIWSTLSRTQYAAYWKDKYGEIEAFVRNNGGLSILGEHDFSAFRRMGEFYRHVGDILATLADIVEPRSFDDLIRYGFSED